MSQVSQQRPGYVTLPRRPKHTSLQPPTAGGHRPVQYDGVGPRTSADGSSTLNLTNNPKKISAPPVLTTTALPALATQESISEERDEVSPLPYPGLPPPFKATVSSPNILNGHSDSDDVNDDPSEASSEVTMLEDLSGYCEPFLPAVLPPPPPTAAAAPQPSATLPRKPSLQKKPALSSIAAPKRKQQGGVRKKFQDEGADGSEV